MSENKKLIPKRRFKEFQNADAWEQRELGEVTIINPQTSLPNVFEYVDLESVVGTEMISHRTEEKSSAPSRAQRLAKQGDIFYQTVRPYQKNNYLFDKLDNNYVFSTGYAQLRPEINSDFLMSYIQDERFVLTVLSNCTGTSYPAISPSSLSKIMLNVPINIGEQEKVGTFFATLDQTIAFQQRKLEKMKSMKLAYLSEMFPAEGERKPKRRFPGFTDDWEQCELGSMTQYKNGKGHEDRQSDTGKYELINLNSISIDGGLKHSGKYIDEVDDTLLKNDLVMVLSDVGHGDLLGRVALIPEDNRFVLNQRVALLRPNETANSSFLFYYINAHQNYFKSKGAGMSQLNISKNSVETFKDYVPSKDEQIQIGQFFTNLDQTITFQQQKLEKLQNIKKAYLNEMFI